MSRAVIGVDLGGTNLRTALVDKQGSILDRHKEATCAAEGHQKVIARLIATIERQRQSAGRRGLEVSAVGVGAPGVIHSRDGIVITSPNFPDWNNLPLRQELGQALNLPVLLMNDANAAALGEQWLGAARSVRSMVLLTLGTGVGGGIVLDGRMWEGADGMAGELGHMTIIPGGRTCGCGNSGCLEMYASSRGIIMSYCEETGFSGDITSQLVYDAARAGDQAAARVIQGMGTALGIGIANLINIFNPEMVVLGGGVKDAWDLFIGPVRSEIGKRAFAYPAGRAQVVPSALGDDAGMVGAAAAALRSLS